MKYEVIHMWVDQHHCEIPDARGFPEGTKIRCLECEAVYKVETRFITDETGNFVKEYSHYWTGENYS